MQELLIDDRQCFDRDVREVVKTKIEAELPISDAGDLFAREDPGDGLNQFVVWSTSAAQLQRKHAAVEPVVEPFGDGVQSVSRGGASEDRRFVEPPFGQPRRRENVPVPQVMQIDVLADQCVRDILLQPAVVSQPTIKLLQVAEQFAIDACFGSDCLAPITPYLAAVDGVRVK